MYKKKESSEKQVLGYFRVQKCHTTFPAVHWRPHALSNCCWKMASETLIWEQWQFFRVKL